MPTNSIIIIGSINMDLVCRVKAMPRPGETIAGTDFLTIAGGKGANQAVAAARLSRNSQVHIIGRVGNDDFGQRLLNGLVQHQVNTRHVTITEGVSTGVAMIHVDTRGENSIVVVPGANHRLTPADIDAAQDLIRGAAVVVLQLEIPLATAQHAIALCQRFGVYTILDPAPAPADGLPRAFYNVDLLSPNQTEAEILLGHAPGPHIKTKRAIEPKQIAGELLAKGAKSVVLKLGAKGAMVVSGLDDIETVKSFKVKVVDTTAAGDGFTGALAVARAEGKALKESIRFANAAGALACTAYGAQPALPTRDAVDALLNK